MEVVIIRELSPLIDHLLQDVDGSIARVQQQLNELEEQVTNLQGASRGHHQRTQALSAELVRH